MWNKLIVLFLPLVMFVENGICLDCFLCKGDADDPDACSNPSVHESSNTKLVTCDFTNAEITWNYAKQIHLNYTGIFKITPMMFVDKNKTEMNCIKVLSRLGNANMLLRGCVLKDQDICSAVKNFENDYFIPRFGNANMLLRGCVLKDQDICSAVKNFENDYLKNLHCSVCDEHGCNSAENVRQNLGNFMLFVFISLVFFGINEY